MSIGEILAAIPAQSQDLRERGYKFRQGKALNDAWANSLDAAGRPDEIKFMRAAAKAGLGPDATQAYWNQQTAAFEAAQRQAQAANVIGSLGGDFRTIKGPAPEPTVTEAPPAGDFGAPAQPSGLSNFLRPKPKGPIDLSAGTNIDAVAQGLPDGEVVVRGQGPETRAPEVGALPALELDRTYTPPAPEGVATQFARSINPTMLGMMAQGMAGTAGVQGAQLEAPALSFETMNQTERQYAERFLARSGIPGTPEDQLRAFEETATRGIAAPVPFNPQRAMVLAPGGGMMLDPSKMAEEQNRATADAARYQAERAKAITDARKALFGAYEGVQSPTIARASAQSSLNEAARPREAINQQVFALNQELGTSFDPSKMGDEKTAADVLERVRLQKNLLERTKEIQVVRDEAGRINGRATLAQIVPLLEGMGKLEGLPGTEGSLNMMVRLLAPSLDFSTMLATGMLDKAGGLTDKGFTYFASQLNNIPIEQVRKLASHMVEASPGMAGIYQNFQSNNPRPLPVVGLDSAPSKPARTAQDQLGDFLRPKRADGTPRPEKPARKPAEGRVTPEQFDRQWAKAKPGDRVVGPDGKTYTKGGR